MTESEWGGLEADTVVRLRETPVQPVPKEIVRLAQISLDGTPDPENPDLLRHAKQIDGGKYGWSEQKVKAFADHMRNAGAHTEPPSSVTVIVDPERQKVPGVDKEGNALVNDKGDVVMVWGPPVNPLKVAYRAGKRRGRNAS